jgi:hypothetical protein
MFRRGYTAVESHQAVDDRHQHYAEAHQQNGHRRLHEDEDAADQQAGRPLTRLCFQQILGRIEPFSPMNSRSFLENQADRR